MVSEEGRAAGRMANPNARRYLVPLALALIVGVGAYLRLWHIASLFDAFGDHEPGTYMMGARSLAQGYLPYRDFVFVQPPLYTMVVAVAVKVLGYSFVLGKYVSVFFSVASIPVIYVIGKRLIHPVAGLVAALLFAVAPDMVFDGGRAVPEALGVFLLVLGTSFVVGYLETPKGWRLLAGGACLGLAVATKYTFLPGFFALLAGVAISLGELRTREWLKRLVQPTFIVAYLAIALSLVGLLLVLSRGLHLPVPVPFLFATYQNVLPIVAIAVSVGIVFVPLVLAIAIMRVSVPFDIGMRWLWRLVGGKEIWLFAAAALGGFVVATSFFWLKAPSQFFQQTFLMQQARSQPLWVPSIVVVLQKAFQSLSEFPVVSYFPVLLSVPLALLLLNRGTSRSSFFLGAVLFVGLLGCQAMLGAPRYYVSLYPFVVLGLAGVITYGDTLFYSDLRQLSARVKVELLSIAGVFLLFITVTGSLLTNYTLYDLGVAIFLSPKETAQAYQETADYLQSVSAKKIWSPNPAYAANAPQVESTRDVDTTALMWFAGNNAQDLVRKKVAEGVDYVILDYQMRTQTDSPLGSGALADEIRKNGHIVKVICPQYAVWLEIWKLNSP